MTGPAARSPTWSRNRCGRSCSSTPRPPCSPAVKDSPTCSSGRSRRSASTTGVSPPRTATTSLWVACTHGDVIKSILADAWHAPRRFPAHRRGTRIDQRHPVHRYATLRVAGQRHRFRPVGTRRARRPEVGTRRRGAGRRTGRATPTRLRSPRRRRADNESVGHASGLTGGGAMARAIHVFRTPDRFIAGTVGEPGDRVVLSAGRARCRGS